MGWDFQSNAVDPFNSDTQYYMRYRTSYYSSGTDATFTVPASPNFPPPKADTPTRYFYEFPGVIDLSDTAGARPISLRNTTNNVDLTRVTGTLGANQYRVSPLTSERRTIIEFHSGLAGKTIAYDFYVTSGVLNGPQLKDLVNDTVTTTDIVSDDINTNTIKANNGYDARRFYKIPSVINGDVYHKHKVVDIGAWNMDTTPAVTIAHGLSAITKIRDIQVIIQNDNADTVYYGLQLVTYVYITSIDATNINMSRVDAGSSGVFDNANFDNTSVNRGWILITYEV